jgi:hypothetical protein
VQALMSRPAPALNRRGEGDSILRGLARCGDCGAAMVVENARRGARVYRYLRCDTAQKQGTERCAGRTRLPLEPVEGVVVGVLREAAGAPGFAATVREALQSRIDVRRSELVREAEALPKAIGEASSRAHLLTMGLVEAPDGAKAVVKKQLEEACALLQAKEARLAELQRESRGLVGLEVDADWVARSIGRFDELWAVLTDANRVVLVQAVVEEVVLDSKREEVRIALVGASPKQARTPAAEAG